MRKKNREFMCSYAGAARYFYETELLSPEELINSSSRYYKIIGERIYKRRARLRRKGV